jgi:hypothetical protein
MISAPLLGSAVVMWIIGRARAVCQRTIESGKSDPQVRNDSITAGCLLTEAAKCPKSAMLPVSETPNQTFFPGGSNSPLGAACALAASPIIEMATSAAARAALVFRSERSFMPGYDWAHAPKSGLRDQPPRVPATTLAYLDPL